MKTAKEQNRSTFDLGEIVQKITEDQLLRIREEQAQEYLKRIRSAYEGCKERGLLIPTILEAAIVLATK